MDREENIKQLCDKASELFSRASGKLDDAKYDMSRKENVLKAYRDGRKAIELLSSIMEEIANADDEEYRER